MRMIIGALSALGITLLLWTRSVLAQPASGQPSMMGGSCMAMMGWPMMLGMGLLWVLLLILMVLAILWLIKQLRS